MIGEDADSGYRVGAMSKAFLLGLRQQSAQFRGPLPYRSSNSVTALDKSTSGINTWSSSIDEA